METFKRHLSLILTNAHMVNGAKAVTVTRMDHREYKARVLSVDTPSDIAVLEIDAHGLPTEHPRGVSVRQRVEMPRTADTFVPAGSNHARL